MLPQTKAFLRNKKYTNVVLGIIKGKKTYLNELDVRYIQIMCKECTEEQFKQFKKDYIIYDGKTKKCRKMTITKSGYFDTPFSCGILSACTELSRRLMFE